MKITNVKVYGLTDSIVASGLPMLSQFDEYAFQEESAAIQRRLSGEETQFGASAVDRHLARAKTLSGCAGGESHDCFLCGVVVQMNVTAPRYWWPEFQRYHFADIVSSTSTMHRLSTFVRRMAELRESGDLDVLETEKARHFAPETDRAAIEAFVSAAAAILSKDGGNIGALKACLPEGWLQTARITTNYRQLKTWVLQRSTHRLREWRDLCEWIHTLPLFDELTTGKKRIAVGGADAK